MDIEAEMERLSREARAKLDAEAPRAAGDDERIDAELAELEREVGTAARARPAPADAAAQEEAERLAEEGSFPWEKVLLVVGAVVVLSVVWAIVQKLLAMLPLILVVGVVGWIAWKLLGKRRAPEP
ncbi:MAG: hypothetical protein R3F62_11455 [Planctomycetota bacterium]